MNRYFKAIDTIARQQSEFYPSIAVDEKTFENDLLRPRYRDGYIVNIWEFDPSNETCVIAYEQNGFLFQEDYKFGISNEYDEYLFEFVYNYCIGECEQTSEEFLNSIH